MTPSDRESFNRRKKHTNNKLNALMDLWKKKHNKLHRIVTFYL